MKVLILTCNMGGGHNSAAAAIAQELAARGIPHAVENALQFAPEEDLIVQGYAFLYKYMPDTWERGYKFSEEHSSYPMYLNSTRYSNGIKRLIEAGGYDTVISVHIFPGQAVTHLRHHGDVPRRRYFVATDYTCSPGVDQIEADAIFVPKGTGREFTLAGVDPACMVETGIPVRPDCYEYMSRGFAREKLYDEVAMSPEDKVVLLGPGVLHVDEIRELVRLVRAEVPETRFVVLTGKGNSSLKRSIAKLGDPRVTGITYTKQMTTWLKAVDLLITKPGGLTSTEAVSCGVPMLLLDVLPGLETHNKDYYVNRHCASTVTGFPALYTECLRLLADEDARRAMIEAQRAHFSTNGVAALVDEVIRRS